MFASDSVFLAHANATLEKWADIIDEELGDRWDVEFSDGILTITLPDHRQYVINRHLGNRQIWLSSPISGAGRFDATNVGWVSARAADTVLHRLLMEEFQTLTGKTVILTVPEYPAVLSSPHR